MLLVRDIVTRVRSAIDELMENDSGFLRTSADELNLARVIRDKIGYALQYVIENAPLEKLDSSMFETLNPTQMAEAFSFVTLGDDKVGRLKLSYDILRIVEARLSSWSHFPIPESDKSQVYLMQQDKYARGSWDRPVNILTYDGSDRILEMYCAKTAQDTLNFAFIRKPDTSAISSYDPTNPSDQTTVSVPSQLEAALVYQIAGLAMVAFREDVAASLFAIAQKYLDQEQISAQTA